MGRAELPVDVTTLRGRCFTDATGLVAFGCLYPGERALRLFGSVHLRQQLLGELQNCELPMCVQVEYVRMLRQAPRRFTPEECWQSADALARVYDLPIGLYALGSAGRRRPLSILARVPWASPAMVMQQLQAAVT